MQRGFAAETCQGKQTGPGRVELRALQITPTSSALSSILLMLIPKQKSNHSCSYPVWISRMRSKRECSLQGDTCSPHFAMGNLLFWAVWVSVAVWRAASKSFGPTHMHKNAPGLKAAYYAVASWVFLLLLLLLAFRQQQRVY